MEFGAGSAFTNNKNGFALNVAGRTSTVLHLADVALAYQLISADSAHEHHLMLATHLHPGFLFLLRNDTLGAALSSAYFYLGAGGRQAEGHLDLTWSWGLGLDVPISGLNDSTSVWLGAVWLRTSNLDEAGPFEEATLNTVLIQLGYRVHN